MERPPRDFGTDSGFRGARGPREERVQGLGHQKAAIGNRSLKLANLVKSSHPLETEACAWQGTPLLRAFPHRPRSARRVSPGQPGTSGSPAPTLGAVRPSPTLAGIRTSARVRKCPPSSGSWLTQDSLAGPLGGQDRPQPGRNHHGGHGALRTSERLPALPQKPGRAETPRSGLMAAQRRPQAAASLPQSLLPSRGTRSVHPPRARSGLGRAVRFWRVDTIPVIM